VVALKFLTEILRQIHALHYDLLLQLNTAFTLGFSGDWIAFVVVCVSGGGSTVSILLGSGQPKPHHGMSARVAYR
jgi:hypothetical protein